MCSNVNHRKYISKLYTRIITVLSEAAVLSYNCKKPSHGRYITGWNKHVKDAHRGARLAFLDWVSSGKPQHGPAYQKMCSTRKYFKMKLKWCQNNQSQIQMDILASHHDAKRFGSFWKKTSRLDTRPSLPVSVGGTCKPVDIANLFKTHFEVQPRHNFMSGMPTTEEPCEGVCSRPIYFSAREISTVLRNMSRGKSPGHDSLSVEHLKHAGSHLPRVLAMFFALSIGHSYLPDDLMKTIVIPIIKNKTSDVSDQNNYRPISLATVIAKVLDGLLDQQLSAHIKLNDAQFGFRAGLSTESAIYCLKHTVQYYAKQRTPVYACFLDLSKAFDLVSYDILWSKLSKETDMPRELVSIFKYWYRHQTNVVRWAGCVSDVYRLNCGVRQGGLTSPKLFNLYMNRLIEELSNTPMGCSVGGKVINNISYADDMVLLSPCISALRKLLAVCESYAAAHGLKYNATKSELLVFKAGNKTYDIVPPVVLDGTPLKKVTKFKYLGHWVVETLCDDLDIERERRALAVRCNMLARRFARSSEGVKITLFRAFCQSFYTCALWVSFTQRAVNALRVQYNNAFRVMMGLPRYCSASGMFAAAGVPGFHAITRSRIASLMRRVRSSTNSILSTLAERVDCPIIRHWDEAHAPVRAPARRY